MTRRARLLAVLAILATGAIGVISSTQTWLTVALRGGGEPLAVPGTAALPVLAPLCLAVLALGAALSIVGTVLRYAFGVLTVAAGIGIAVLVAPLAIAPPASAVASAVTSATGIAGAGPVADLVTGITATPWPAVTLVAAVLLSAAGVFVLVTAHAWRRTGRRYAAEPAAAPAAVPGGGTRAPKPADAPLDALDSWDGLSRGEDPTD